MRELAPAFDGGDSGGKPPRSTDRILLRIDLSQVSGDFREQQRKNRDDAGE
jgi:hypothetical protein